MKPYLIVAYVNRPCSARNRMRSMSPGPSVQLMNLQKMSVCFAVSRQKERAFQLRVKNEYLGFLAREKTRYHKTGEWL